MIGFAALGVCFKTQQEAADYFAVQTYPRQDNGILYSVFATSPNGTTGANISLFAHNYTAPTIYPVNTYISLPSCDSLTFYQPLTAMFNAPFDPVAFNQIAELLIYMPLTAYVFARIFSEFIGFISRR